MFQDENNIYEIAYMMCNESIKKMLGDDLNIVIDKAVDDTVMMFSPKVKDCDALKKYLHSRISREREEDESIQNRQQNFIVCANRDISIM